MNEVSSYEPHGSCYDELHVDSDILMWFLRRMVIGKSIGCVMSEQRLVMFVMGRNYILARPDLDNYYLYNF